MAVLLAGQTLARAPLEGGSRREIAEHVSDADWARDGSRFAIVRDVDGRQRVEYPIGKVLYQTAGVERIEFLRVSPAGDRVAFIDYPARSTDQSGDVVVVDLSGRKHTLSKDWALVQGLAWWPDGREVWFTANTAATVKALHAVTLAGKERLVMRLPGTMGLYDIAAGGRVLLAAAEDRFEIRGRMAGDTAERDLSWLDGTFMPIISPDGTRILFMELLEGGGERSSVYFRRIDGPLPVRLGDGWPLDASPDWKWALCLVGVGSQAQLHYVPIGAGEDRSIPRGSISAYAGAGILHPDGTRLLIVGSEAGRPQRVFLQELPNGIPRPVSPEGVSYAEASLDGRRVAFVVSEPGDASRLYVRDLPDGPLRSLGLVGAMEGVLGSVLISPDGRFVGARPPGPRAPFVLYPADGGPPRPIPGVEASDESLAWSEDGRYAFVQASGNAFPLRLVRVDLRTGHREPWLELTPPDCAGVLDPPTNVFVTLKSEGRFFVYGYERVLGALYVVDGLK